MVFDAHTRLLENFDHALMEAQVKYMGPVLRRMQEEMAKNMQH